MNSDHIANDVDAIGYFTWILEFVCLFFFVLFCLFDWFVSWVVWSNGRAQWNERMNSGKCTKKIDVKGKLARLLLIKQIYLKIQLTLSILRFIHFTFLFFKIEIKWFFFLNGQWLWAAQVMSSQLSSCTRRKKNSKYIK